MSQIDDINESQLLDRLICLDAEIRFKNKELRVLALRYDEASVMYRNLKGYVEQDDDKLLSKIRSEIDKFSEDSL